MHYCLGWFHETFKDGRHLMWHGGAVDGFGSQMGFFPAERFGYVFLTNLEPSLDRKSTRLNSSHANISYAVFCLKKNTILSHYFIFLDLFPTPQATIFFVSYLLRIPYPFMIFSSY